MVVNNPEMYMVLGEVGSGKTTFCLSFSKFILNSKKKKVIYLSTRANNIEIINRVIFDSPVDQTSFISLSCETFNSILTEVSQLETYVSNETRVFKECPYGAIIVDNLFEFYMMEIGTDYKNSGLNRKLNIILAILNNIVQNFKIPVLMTNIPKSGQASQDISNNKHKEMDISGYYGGTYSKYWISNILKLERTGFQGIRKLRIALENVSTLSDFTMKIDKAGFI